MTTTFWRRGICPTVYHLGINLRKYRFYCRTKTWERRDIHRHSGSSTAAIRILQKGSRLRVQVQDNGRGIPQPKQLELMDSSRGGVGVGSMRERLRQFGGTLDIESNGAGTVVSATLEIITTKDNNKDRKAGTKAK